MKKLILAAAIAAVTANSATAATIYNDKGLTYKIKGDWQIQLRDSHKKSEDLDVEFDDLEIKNSVVYDLGNDMQAFGQLDFGFKNIAEGKSDNTNLEEAYIGLAFSGVSVSIGKQNFAGDEFGIEGAYETELKEDMFDDKAASGDDVIKVEAEMGAVDVILSHNLAAKGNKSGEFEATDLFVATEFSGLSLAAAYQTYEKNDTSNDVDTWGLSAEFDAGFASVGIDYSTAEEGSVDTDLLNLVAAFKASKTTKFNLGYVRLDSDNNAEDADTFYANVTYKFPAQKNVSLFAEVSKSDYDDAAEDAKHETDVLAGMRVKF